MSKDFAYNLRRLRKERGLTLDELAESVNKKYGTNINKSMISKWENGYDAKVQSIMYLSAFFNVTINEILSFNEEVLDNGKVNFKIPIFGIMSAGEPIFSDENILGYASPPPAFELKGRSLNDLFYLKVKGDSMDKIYPDGSYVLVRRNSFLQNDDNAVLLINEANEAVLKKVKMNDNILTLISVSKNPNHLPKIIDTNQQSVRIIGKVIGCYIKE